jgi:tyrosine-specific transport protein
MTKKHQPSATKRGSSSKISSASASAISKAPKASLLTCVGAILIIIGTTIGGGMLALPVVTSKAGFLPSIGALFVIWFFMSVGAWFILKVNEKFSLGTHFISMTKETLGNVGMWITLFFYVVLLYSLIAAYFSAGIDLVETLASFEQVALNHITALAIFAGIFCTIVIFGIRTVDIANRLIMILKIGSFLAMAGTSLIFVQPKLLFTPGQIPNPTATMSIITAFGFAILIPSIRRLIPNTQQLEKVLWIGSFVPLICYIIWETLIFGIIPREGALGLQHLALLPNPIDHLILSISQYTQDSSVILTSKIFTSVCVITAFLGVSLSLSDGINDLLNPPNKSPDKKKFSNKWIFSLTFIPPIIFVLFLPQVFVAGISLAGIICVILLMMIPALMAYKMTKSRHAKFWIGLYLLATVGFLIISLKAFSL